MLGASRAAREAAAAPVGAQESHPGPGGPVTVPQRSPRASGRGPYPAAMARGRGTATATAVASGLLLLVTACAAPGVQAPRPVAVVVDTGADCASTDDPFVDLPVPPVAPRESPAPPPAGSVPDDFSPTSAVLCEADLGATVEDDAGRWTAVREVTHEGDPGLLLAALDAPDEPGGTGMCTADLEIVPDLWLVDDDGRALRAAWPRDTCGKTLPGTREALGALRVSGERLVPVSLVETREALDAGCATRATPARPFPWTDGDGGTGLDVDSAPETGSVPGAGPALPAVPAAPLPAAPLPDPADLDRACLYVVPEQAAQEAAPGPAPEPTDEPGQGAAGAGAPAFALPPSGTFDGVVALPPADAAALVAAAGAASTPELERCGTPVRAFATFPVGPADDSGATPALSAELDGCGRLLTADGGARPLPAGLAALVAGA